VSQRTLTRAETARLMGKRVRLWLGKKRGEGRPVEGVVDRDLGGLASFPHDEGGRWVVDAKRTLDVFENDAWVEMFPRGSHE